MLRPEDQPPAVHRDPLVVSFLASLAAGILAGPVGSEILGDGSLVDFFTQLRQWYGHNPDLVGVGPAPAGESFNLGQSARTTFEAFNIFVPFSNKLGKCDLGSLLGGTVNPPDFSQFFAAQGAQGRNASIVGPTGFGAEQFIPVGHDLPFTIQFQNPGTASSHVGEVRIVQQLDPNLDVRSFRLGDIKVGDINVHLPSDRGSFQGDFDFSTAKGFILRVSAGVDVFSGVATWLLQAIDPETGEVVQDPNVGLLAPNNAQGAGSGFASYTIRPLADAATGALVKSSARVLFNTLPPEDTTAITDTVDSLPPTTVLTANLLTPGGSDYQIDWTATDNNGGSGVRHVTVYVAEDGGAFQIFLSQSTANSAIFQGTPGHSYEFLALAIDNAGNRELPPPASRRLTTEAL